MPAAIAPLASAAGLACLALLAPASVPARPLPVGPLAPAAAGAAGAPAPAATPAAPRFVERPGELELTGRLIVRPKTAAERTATLDGDDAAAAGLEADPDAHARRDAVARARLLPMLVEHVPGPDRWVIAVPPGRTEEDVAAELLATGDYAYVHPDWRCFPAEAPNDPQYDQQWHHQTMDSEGAWAIGTGSPDVVLAFVDTGVDLDHPDLAPLLVPGFNSVDDLPQAAGGDVSDVNGHGTAVGGSLGAIGDNGIGVAGVGWSFGLMPIKTSNAPGGGAALSNILQGAEWAIEQGARAASASYTGVQAAAVQDTGAYIRSLGGIFLYAGNNNAEDHAGFDWPDVVVVGATDPSDGMAGFSSFGLGVDLFAPGVAIRTTTNGGGYGDVSGTSFATPIANGALGLLWSIDPTLTSLEVEQILSLTAEDKGEPGNDAFWGWGRIDLGRAAEVAAGLGTPQPPVAIDDAAVTATGYEVQVDVLANDYDLNLDPVTIASVDATTALGGTVEIEPGAGPGGRDVLRYVPPAAVGMDTFSYAAGDADGTTSATVTVEVLDPAGFRAPDQPLATAPGATAAYYVLFEPEVLPDFEQLTSYRVDVVPEVGFASTNGEFATSGRSDDVGAVFEGFIEVPSAAEYVLSVESDDGSKLYLGDALIVDNDGLHGMVEVSAEAALLPGRHAVRVEFFERGGGAGCIVRIEGGGLVRQVVPASMWSHPVDPPCPADVDASGTVDFDDLLAAAAAWGACPPLGGCPGDVDGSGIVDFDDLLAVLAAWGPCPG